MLPRAEHPNDFTDAKFWSKERNIGPVSKRASKLQKQRRKKLVNSERDLFHMSVFLGKQLQAKHTWAAGDMCYEVMREAVRVMCVTHTPCFPDPVRPQ